MLDTVSGVRIGIGIIGDAALAAGEAAAIAAYPWLGLPVIKQIWEAILGKFVAAALLEMENSSSRIIIPIIDQAQADAASAAADKLKADLADAQTKNEALANDLADFKAKYSELIRMRRADPYRLHRAA